jgi:hypothetical protein
MKCDHCEVKRFVCLMYNCTDLNICAFCSSDKLSSPNSKVSISKLSRNCILFVNCSRASTYKQHFCFNSNVYSVVEKTNDMTFNPNTTLKLIHWFIYHQSSVPFKELSSIILYNYHPCWSVTRRFVYQRKVMSPEGDITFRGETNRGVTFQQGW